MHYLYAHLLAVATNVSLVLLGGVLPLLVLFINSIGCNYTVKSEIYSSSYGKGELVGQCYLGVTEYLASYQDGTTIKVKALSLAVYDRIVFIDTERQLSVASRSNNIIEEKLSLDIPVFYPLKYIRISKDRIVALTPQPKNQLFLLEVYGAYSLLDSITPPDL